MEIVITRSDGTSTQHRITPRLEVAFEKQWKGGFGKIFREQEKQEHLYWLAWEALRQSGTTVEPFGDKFLDGIESVEFADEGKAG